MEDVVRVEVQLVGGAARCVVTRGPIQDAVDLELSANLVLDRS
jgi:hypothetical protein